MILRFSYTGAFRISYSLISAGSSSDEWNGLLGRSSDKVEEIEYGAGLIEQSIEFAGLQTINESITLGIKNTMDISSKG
jgi:hypothetical protein